MTTTLKQTPFIDSPVSVPLATEFRLCSQILDEERNVLVRVPESYERGDGRYPVLYMLDGERPLFTSHAGVITQLSEWEGGIPEMILVGIPNTDRPRDMLPKAIELPNGRSHGGGADAFLSFVTQELIPAMDDRYRTHPFRILSGTSASGLTATYALTIGLEGFRAFIASSPTVGYDDRFLFDLASSAFQRLNGERFLAIFSGDSDMEGIQQDSEDFATLVQDRAPGLVDVKHWIHEGEGHCPFDGFRRALLALYEDWQPSDEVLDAGIDSLQEHYQGLSESFGYVVDVPVSAYEAIGERMIGSGNASGAAEILRSGLERHVGSTRVAFYLAIALARSDQRQAARELLEDLLATERPGNNRLAGLLKQLED